MFQKSVFTLLLTSIYFFSLGQSTLENDRIAELYDLISDMSLLYGSEVNIYDYKLKNKRTIKDSSFVAMFYIVDKQDDVNQVVYDTLNQLITKYEVQKGIKIPKETFLLNNKERIIEHSIVNKDRQVLAKTFFKYSNGLLISEEAYTGYAYLNEPRMISQISYKYEKGKLSEKNKKYSLNGEHWIQTWKTKYNENGKKELLEEIDNGSSTTYEYLYNSKQQIDVIAITSDSDKKSKKEIDYFADGSPKSILWYWVKKNKPIRMTKYFYD